LYLFFKIDIDVNSKKWKILILASMNGSEVFGTEKMQFHEKKQLMCSLA
jgi:hypothetical protein